MEKKNYQQLRKYEERLQTSTQPMSISYAEALTESSSWYMAFHHLDPVTHPTDEVVKAEELTPSPLPPPTNEKQQTIRAMEHFVKENATEGKIAFKGGEVTLIPTTPSGGRYQKLPYPLLTKEELLKTIQGCHKCSHYLQGEIDHINELEVNSGPIECLFVGHLKERKSGELQCFEGETNELLSKMIAAMKFQKGKVARTLSIKCSTLNLAQAPYDKMWQNCLPYLYQEIALYQPKVVITLGGVATNYILGGSDSLAQTHGKFFPHTLEFQSGEQVSFMQMPIFHPEYLLHNTAKKADTWTDLKKVISYLAK